MNHSKNINTNCQNALDKLIEQMEQDHFDDNQLTLLIQENPTCQESLESTYAFWKELNTLATPSPRAEMSTDFYRKLNEYSAQKIVQPSIFSQIKNWLANLNPMVSWSMALGLFVFGFFSGQFFQVNAKDTSIQPMAEVQHYNPDASVSGRMKEIQLVRKMENPNQRILEALNKALTEDPNVNVRLSAIETLLYFAEDPTVMEILIKAIPHQSSSLVQLELAEVMIQLEEKRSADEWKELLNSDKVERDVKIDLEESLQVLM